MSNVNNGPSVAVSNNMQAGLQTHISTGVTTFANLPPASRHGPEGTNYQTAWTSDQGLVYSNGTAWVGLATASNTPFSPGTSLPAGVTAALGTSVNSAILDLALLKTLEFDIRDYGAVDTTGVVSSYPAFAAAYAAAAAAGGGRIMLPSGTLFFDTALTLTTSSITIQGCGGMNNQPGTFSATTRVKLGTNNFITISGNIFNLVLTGFLVYSTSGTPGNVIGLTDGTSSLHNLTTELFFVEFMNHVIDVGNGNALDTWRFNNSQFGYLISHYMLFESGSVVSEGAFNSSRFEENQNFDISYIKAFNAVAFSATNCVFEGCHGKYPINLGNNFRVEIKGCHFEGNGQPLGGSPSTGACDIAMGFGGTLLIDSNTFYLPFSTATNYYAILGGYSQVRVVNNKVFGAGHAGYLGFIQNDVYPNFSLSRNAYVEGGSPFNYLTGVVSPVRENDFQSSDLYGSYFGPIVKNVQTTDATLTAIWAADYQFIPATGEGLLVTAEVLGMDATGTAYYAQVLRTVFSKTSAYSVTARGTINETAVASSTQTAAFAIQNNNLATVGLKLNVTGLAATTIKWTAKITLQRCSF